MHGNHKRFPDVEVCMTNTRPPLHTRWCARNSAPPQGCAACACVSVDGIVFGGQRVLPLRSSPQGCCGTVLSAGSKQLSCCFVAPKCTVSNPCPPPSHDPCPAMMMQTHCQVSREKASASSFLRVVRQQGLPRLWRGAPVMFVGCVPSHAAYVAHVCMCVCVRTGRPRMCGCIKVCACVCGRALICLCVWCRTSYAV